MKCTAPTKLKLYCHYRLRVNKNMPFYTCAHACICKPYSLLSTFTGDPRTKRTNGRAGDAESQSQSVHL